MYRSSFSTYWLLLTLVCLCFLGVGESTAQKRRSPQAKKGVLDLRKVPLTSPVTLDGEWSFHWGVLQRPNSKKKLKSHKWISVPGDWNRSLKDKSSIPGIGIATYRLKIRLSEKHPKRLMLHTTRVTSAYELWLNGKLIHSMGKISATPEGSAMEIGSKLIALPPATELDLVVLISNHRHRSGGLRRSWRLGKADVMLALQKESDFYSGILPSIILFTGLMFLVLGAVRRESSWLWFGAFCFATAVRTAAGNEILAIRMILPWLSTAEHLRIEYISIFCISGCVVGAFASQFPRQAPRILVPALIGLSFLCAIAASVLPLRVVLFSLPLFGVLSITAMLTSFWIIWKAWRAKESLAGVLIAAFVIAFTAFLYDYFTAMGFLPPTRFELTPFTFPLFIFLQTYALALRFAKSFDRIKSLSDELKGAYDKLQKEHDQALQELEEAREIGNYRLEELLGAGGMGEVWRASHRLLARPAAVKLILPKNYTNDSQGMLRFEREAQTTALLRSPHTVELYDFGQSPKGEFYYAMELLEGLDLDDFLKKFGTMSPNRVIHILHQVCLSLAEAHEAGLVHRDIKPANIFLCRMGIQYDFIKVLDFGLVKPLDVTQGQDDAEWMSDPAFLDQLVGVLDAELGDADTMDPDQAIHDTLVAQPKLSKGASQSMQEAHSSMGFEQELTKVGSITGTPLYMSPEQIQNKPLDGRSDLYALGCIAYQLLSGRTVFPDVNTFQLLFNHISSKPVPLSKSSEQFVPQELATLIEQCLEKNPKNRPESASVVARHLAKMAEVYPWNLQDATKWWLLYQDELET